MGFLLTDLNEQCRVWNTIALLCACHKDTEAGQQEEEEEEKITSYF